MKKPRSPTLRTYITDAMYDEVRRFAQLVRLREEQSRSHPPQD